MQRKIGKHSRLSSNFDNFRGMAINLSEIGVEVEGLHSGENGKRGANWMKG